MWNADRLVLATSGPARFKRTQKRRALSFIWGRKPGFQVPERPDFTTMWPRKAL